MQQFINRNNSYDYVIKYTGEFAQTTVYSKPIYTGYARTHTPKRGKTEQWRMNGTLRERREASTTS